MPQPPLYENIWDIVLGFLAVFIVGVAGVYFIRKFAEVTESDDDRKARLAPGY